MSFLDFAVQRERKNVEKIISQQKSIRLDNVVSQSFLYYGAPQHRRNFIHVFKPVSIDVEIKGIIVDIHGGGLIAGSVEQNRNFCTWAANKGYVVYSIEYRLIPEVDFITQLCDICNALTAIKEHKKKFENKPVYMCADSAGALLGLITLGITSEKDDQVALDFGILATDTFHFDGAWFQSPLFETTGFNKIGLFMAKHYYGKNWKKQDFAKYLQNPYQTLRFYLPEWVVITTSDSDDLYYQAVTAQRNWCSKTFIYSSSFIDHYHDWSVLEPKRDEYTVEMNEWALKTLN